ncbi:MAG TPA: cysteine desulfurase family protein [Pirellulales bacterium]|jgi:cysteine desulfurase|nr:cysteine desulfurase family protein [Pirellulales bacterium]
MQAIYLDHNSTAPLLPEVAAAMAQADAAGYANPASQHSAGRHAHQLLEDAREEIARLLGANLTGAAADRLIFTSGGTEANNLALFGLAGAAASNGTSSTLAAQENRAPGRIIISSIEHPSVTASADFLAKCGWQVDRLAVTSEGVVELKHLDELLSTSSPFGPPRLVSVMLANNETGVLQPIAEIAARCQAAGVPVHTDAVQAVGKVPVNFRALGVAAMTVAGHKFGGPRGMGALLVKQAAVLRPILHGATQQFGLRPGTESVSLALGFLAALRSWANDRDQRPRRLAALRDRLEAGIRTIYPAAIVNGKNASRLSHTSNVAFVGHNRQALFMALDMAGICCSTGSACASGSSEPSPTLLAMHLPREVVQASLRFSLGVNTTAEEIDDALRRLAGVLNQHC